MSSKKLRLLAVSWFVALSPACLPIWVGNDMKERIDELEREQNETEQRLEKQREKLQTKIEEANTEVEELREVLEKARNLLERNSADLGADIQATREEMQKLRGAIEESKFRLRRLRKELELFKEDVELRFSTGGLAGKLPDDPDDLFEYGEKKLEEGELDAAKRAFTTFKSEFRDDERVDDAQVYLADVEFEAGEWINAIVKYRKVLQNYPDSELIPKATYNIGVAFMNLGKCGDAKPFLETVWKEHGDSRFSSPAKKKLEAIGRGECPSGSG